MTTLRFYNGESFEEMAVALGFYRDFISTADGSLHRVKVDRDRPGQKSGWYVRYSNGLASGAAGNWKTGQAQTWCEKSRQNLSPTEKALYRQQMLEAQAAREREQARNHELAAEKAARIMVASHACDVHAYLEKKNVGAYGVREVTWSQGFRSLETGERERLSEPALLIPMYDASEKLWSIAAIASDGRKDFLWGGKKKGCFHLIGKVGDTVCIAEGYATAATIHEATGYAVFVAFDAGNMVPVAAAVRNAYPAARIIVCADNDQHTPGNPGLTKGTEAARAVGGLVAAPWFEKDAT